MSQNGSRDYNAAVAALNSLQSNFSIVEAIKKRGPGWNKQALPEMRGWVQRIGYEVCVKLRSIKNGHVAHMYFSRPILTV